MPTSTQRGFLTGKWELKYLRRRFRAHRNKVAATGPAIDSKTPPERPHVTYKVKKAVTEERRQAQILTENFRILRKTAEIMGDCENVIGRTTSEGLSKTKFTSDAILTQSTNTPRSPRKFDDRPMTANTKKNYHIIHRWFQIKFGKYVPWWAQITY